MNAFTREDLKRFQAESLDQKEQRSLAKIAEWFSYWNNAVYVAFSGGKDSSVLADLCGFWCSIIKATLYLCFVNTGLEYPEIQKHVRLFAEYLRNKYDIEVVLDIIRPEMRFDEVIKTYGYPIISKDVSQAVYDARTQARKEGIDVRQTRLYNRGFNHESDYCKKYPSYCRAKYDSLFDMQFGVSHKCCDVMKKKPAKQYEKETGRKPILATMTSESRLRQTKWIQYGCNAFDSKRPNSAPMSFWTEQDVLQYIKDAQLPIASVYGDIVYAEDPDQMRIEDYGIDCGSKEKLRTTGCTRTGCIFCAFGCHLDKETSQFQKLKETHPKQYKYCMEGGEYNEYGIWQPNKQGLGMRHVFDELNKIYGDGFIKY